MGVFIKASNLCIDFPIFNSSNKSLRKNILNVATGGKIAEDSKKHTIIKALNNINLDLKPGDKLGITGHNGSGKSTLLRCLAGAYHPTSGTVETSGRIASLLDIHLGINGEATGYENIIVRGILMGMSKKEIESKVDEIADFADLGEFLSMPVRTYSSGMTMRLGFAVSTSINADIILMDEWLSVGDENFNAKASKRLDQMMEESSILVIASHNKELIQNTCNKELSLKNGSQT